MTAGWSGVTPYGGLVWFTTASSQSICSGLLAPSRWHYTSRAGGCEAAQRFLQMPPAQRWRETREIGIGRYPFAPALYGKRRMGRIGDELSPELSGFAELAKNAPMLGSGPDRYAAGPFEESIHESKGLGQCGWRIEDPWVGRDPKEALKDGLGKRERFRSRRQGS